jgi:hypothetical protein
MTTDYRNILARHTTRKPETWDEAPIIGSLNDIELEALRSLPVIETAAAPLEYFHSGELLEFVARVGERAFYVDAEGYRYARYVFEFDPQLLRPREAQK